MKAIVRALIDWPERLAAPLAWLGPLLARITVGWVFLWVGRGKLGALPQVIGSPVAGNADVLVGS